VNVQGAGEMTNNDKQPNILFIDLNERNIAVLVHSLFSSWMLSFLFEGQIFQQLAKEYNFSSESIIIWSSAAMFSGLLLGGFVIKSKLHAKRLFLYSYPLFIALSLIFFFSPSVLWTIGIITGSIVSGWCVAAWGFYFKSVSGKNERIKIAADMLVISNILMILENVVAINMSPQAGLSLSLVMLIFAFILGLRLPTDYNEDYGDKKDGSLSISNLLLFFYIFIVILTINSGLMYHVVNPAFEHHAALISWYRADSFPFFNSIAAIPAIKFAVTNKFFSHILPHYNIFFYPSIIVGVIPVSKRNLLIISFIASGSISGRTIRRFCICFSLP
jgi:hypothetical protein